MLSQETRDFYATHSPTSDPGPLSWLLDGLPRAIDELIDAIGGVLLHPITAAQLLGEPEPADQGAGELTMMRTLERVHAIDPAPMSVARPITKRLRVNCRGFAMLFVTALRHQGVPVRKRVGFDCGGDIHEIGEYWDEQREQWVLVDPDPASREPLRAFLRGRGHTGRLESSTELIRHGEAYHAGGLAWRLCRSGQAEVGAFRDTAYAGMAGVRVALLQDLDSLIKVELRSFDEWHELITQPWEAVDRRWLDWLDAAAELTADMETNLGELRAFYVGSAYGSVVRTRLAQVVR